MKKLLMLGGSHLQIPAIKKAREMGHYVITCDYLEENPGHQYAHEYYNVSTTDREAVLQLAKKLNVDGIVCYVADSGAATVAYVAEKLGLPSYSSKAVHILTNKDRFRQFQLENGFHIPRAKGYRSYEEAKMDFHHFKMPVMIKPVDASGSKGISKIDNIELLQEKVRNALHHSRAKRFIIEEYIENYGPHVGGDGFCVDGKLVFRCFSNEYFSTDRLNPFVSILATWPYIMPEHIQTKIHDEIQRVVNLLNMQTGALNFDIRVDDEENVYIIEIAPRNGGEWNPHAIKYATGIDLIEYTIKAALGEDCSGLTMAAPQGYWASYVLNSAQTGIFKGVEIDEEFQKHNMVEFELVVNTGDEIYALSGSHEKVGIMILQFASMAEMTNKMKNIDHLIKVIVEDSSLANVTKR
ncbi:ATP-grasp domain-containing protein [Lysinibacillus sp. KU-BSD001]|uniref:ATP-grasp domain-containing protein n=1 Tax=Lysinibacillus sp. KU-BSD001 TaxID=3141328 RepID=UPI0036E8A20A